jgi:hypothetical protein
VFLWELVSCNELFLDLNPTCIVRGRFRHMMNSIWEFMRNVMIQTGKPLETFDDWTVKPPCNLPCFNVSVLQPMVQPFSRRHWVIFIDSISRSSSDRLWSRLAIFKFLFDDCCKFMQIHCNFLQAFANCCKPLQATANSCKIFEHPKNVLSMFSLWVFFWDVFISCQTYFRGIFNYFLPWKIF